MLSVVEQTRLQVSKNTEVGKKSKLGQFFTPEKTAVFMSELFPPANGVCRLLDAGAGIGSLSAAFLDRWNSGDLQFERVELDAFEIDSSLRDHLIQTLTKYKNKSNFSHTVRISDFIHAASDWTSGNLFAEVLPQYTHVILNPPYKKISSDSAHRIALRQAGIETVNLYSAFLALAILLTEPGGQIVAIIPRSFCNGPYYRSFRKFILERSAIRHIHLFKSRNKAFKDDEVLQENIIMRLERNAQQAAVTVSTSTDDSFADLITNEHSFDRIVFSDDPEQFIHIPTSVETNIQLYPAIHYALSELDIKVSTGPVVDFRLKEHLRNTPDIDSVPLLYPNHLNSSGRLEWPSISIKKPNAIQFNQDTERWLYPNGFYCVVRRLSSKEEKHRIVANVVDPSMFGHAKALGFENHLNLFHENKRGLPQVIAHGLAVFLNSTAADESFRRFNGHTQVNATDLKQMKYPSREALSQLGAWAIQCGALTQTMIDSKIKAIAV